MKYATIVADPPWDHSDGTGFHYGSLDPRRVGGPLAPKSVDLAYPHLSVGAICELPVSELAEGDAHLYLWTTNRYLRDAYDVAETWGFQPVKPLVWCKEPMGFMGGCFTSSAEFILFARRGTLGHLTKAGRQWWTWKRPYRSDGKPDHSHKPDAFLDLVEQVSPGPYLELFARRQRLGWDTWGNEALEHLDMDEMVASYRADNGL